MKNRLKILIISTISIIILILAMGVGSVVISPIETVSVILNKIFGYQLIEVKDTITSILWSVRFPRVLLAFVCGSALALSGSIMQSVLKNNLASSYTLGVSSGAGLGASIAILLNITIFGIFTLQIFGFLFGMATVWLTIMIATKIDKGMKDNSIILTGVALSLFANAMLSIMLAFADEDLQSLIFWQMGSFASKDAVYLYILYPIVLIILLMLLFKHREMDIMTFGDEQATSSGVDVKRTKWYLLFLSSILTGFIVSIAGIIGFVDLFTPHVSRKIFGASHKYVLLASAVMGGSFMVLCDLIARSIVAPRELPVGAITSAIGAPFFIYLYFTKRKS